VLRPILRTVPGVAGIVLMLRGASGKDVVAGVKEKLEVARRSLPEDVTIVPFYDRSELVETALGTVRSALFQGAVLVVLVPLFFMGHVRSAFLVVIQLPMAALGPFLVMRMVGLSANLMTLSGLAIAIGMLGDGAIVLIETAIGGKVVTTVPEGDRRTDVVVRLPRAYSAKVENLRDLPLMTPSAERVLLREVASIDIVAGPAQISREDGKRRVVVSGVGSEIQKPLAVVVVSGVVTSTLLTLIVLPVLYDLFGRSPVPNGSESCESVAR